MKFLHIFFMVAIVMIACDQEPLVFLVEAKKKGKKAKNDYHCDTCDKDGHTSSHCWFNPDGNRHRKCTVCGEDGHLARSCKKNVQKEKPVKQVAASDEIQYSDSDSEPEEDH